ncbi:carbohydrate ABC transporter permease [Paenibacillus prosopidis]|uniref:Carbohydrate ABC transporter membrane protein 2 (CUT1 family) n=1 Tax=Paenibacillus prosopidis TaxID=630520 RepID=A0A368VR28_9BACL|nr:carbohydrate ABC transporter permease [Paenibacillus prosopidis]RCW43475.1 carbohydrate ABC transporter membrane protein 2 (CUT1 family) [Paenibacillus prosopidis]
MESIPRKVFLGFNYTFFILISLLCLFPLIHVLAVSFSSSDAVTAGLVKFWPVEFTTRSYEYMLNKPEFFQSMVITVQRVILGTVFGLLLCLTIAYPLSKEVKAFRLRTYYAWFFVFTILFNGGLIPGYMVVRNLGLLDSIWALILPSAVNVFNILLMLNFFRALPKELEESAFIDGAGHWTALWRIYLPLSLPSFATITLFTIVYHWNSWFDGLIFMNKPENYPLSTYLQNIIMSGNLINITSSQSLEQLKDISDRTAKAAQIFIGTLPILIVYPFLQRFFIHGIVLGSVKE